MQPDFLCFGSTRSGTTFLHARLREHPDVWLPPQKELHYFTSQRQRGWLSRKNLRHVRDAPAFLTAALGGAGGAAAELRWQLRYYFGARTDDWYLSLFDAPAGLLTGAIEPSYAKLSPEMVRVVHEFMPNVKLIYIMRDPIERSWSSVTKSVAKNRGRPMSGATERDILQKLERSTLYMSTYVEHLSRWEKVFPKKSFFYGFFDDIEGNPGGFLDRVCTHIGIRPFRCSDVETLTRPVNDTHGYKVEIPTHIERFLSERLIQPTRALARRFGGPAERWAGRMERALSRTQAIRG